MLTAPFVRAKHWQIFLLFLTASFLMQVAAWIYFAAMLNSREVFGWEVISYVLMTGICMAVCYAWFWSVGAFLNSLVEFRLRPGRVFFAVALIYPALYVIFAMVLLFRVPVPSLGLILPLHLFAMFCMLYTPYFVSKNLVLAETGRRVKFYDFVGPLFLLLFFPIGIWFVQPRINHLYETATKSAQGAMQN